MPSLFIFPSKEAKYYDVEAKQANIKSSKTGQIGREEGIRRLMSINLLKRLESSVYSFKLTLTRVQQLITSTLQNIENFKTMAQILILRSMITFTQKMILMMTI